MEMPDAVKWLLPIVVGESWPEGDETKLRALRDAWHTASSAIGPVSETGGQAASGIRDNWTGDGADAFAEQWKKFVEGDEAYFKQLADATKALGDSCDQTALDVEYTKYMIIISLIVLAAQIAAMIAAAAVTFGGSTAGIAPAQIATRMTVQMLFRQLLEKLAQQGFKQVAKELLEKLLKQGLKKIGMEVLKNEAINLGMDVGIQGLQMAKGDRQSWDWSKTSDAAISGAVGGVVGAASGSIGRGATEGLSHSAGGQIADAAMRAGTRGAVEGVAQTVGQAAVTGDLGSLTPEQLLMGASSGAVGGAVGGAKEQLHSVHETNIPGEPGGSGSSPERSSRGEDASGGERPETREAPSEAESRGEDARREPSAEPESRGEGTRREASSEPEEPRREASSGPETRAAAEPEVQREPQRADSAPEHRAPEASRLGADPVHQAERQPEAHRAVAEQAPPAAGPSQGGYGMAPPPGSGPEPGRPSVGRPQENVGAAGFTGGPSQPFAADGGAAPFQNGPSPQQVPPAGGFTPPPPGGMPNAGGPGSAGGPGPRSGGPTPPPMAPRGGQPTHEQPRRVPPQDPRRLLQGGQPPMSRGGQPTARATGRPPQPVQPGGQLHQGGQPPAQPGSQPRHGGPPAQPGHPPVQPGGPPYQGGPPHQNGQQSVQPGGQPPQGARPHPGRQASPGGPLPQGGQPTQGGPPPQHGGQPQHGGPPPQWGPRVAGQPHFGPPVQGGLPPHDPRAVPPARPPVPPHGGPRPPMAGGQRPAGYPNQPRGPQGPGPHPGGRPPVPPQDPRLGPSRPAGAPQVPPPRFGPPQEHLPRGPVEQPRPTDPRMPHERPFEQPVVQERPMPAAESGSAPAEPAAEPVAREQAVREQPAKHTPEAADAQSPVQHEQPAGHGTDEPYLADPGFRTEDPAGVRRIEDTFLDSGRHSPESGEWRHEQVRREALAKRDEFHPGVSDAGAFAVHAYTRYEMVGPLNHALRTGGPELLDLAPQAGALVSGLNELPPHAGTVSRRIDFHGDPARLQAFLGRFHGGAHITEPSFLSSSKVDAEHPRSSFPGEVEMRIQAKTGRDVEALASIGHEREVLFKAGTQFEITGIEKGPGHPDNPNRRPGEPQWVVHAEEIAPGDPRHLGEAEARNAVEQRRADERADEERFQREADAELEQFYAEHPHLKPTGEMFKLTAFDDPGAPPAPVRRPPATGEPEGGWAQLAEPLRPGGAPVLHAGSVETPQQHARLVRDAVPELGAVNTRNHYSADALETGFRTNAAESMVAFERRMTGEDVVAGPARQQSLAHVGDQLGGRWSSRESFDGVAQELGERPVGARTAVAFEHVTGEPPHVESRLVAAVHTEHGIVFADPVTGRLAELPHDATGIHAMPLGGGEVPHQAIADRLNPAPERVPHDEGYLFDGDHRGTPADHESIRRAVGDEGIYQQIHDRALARRDAAGLPLTDEGAVAVHGYTRGEYAYDVNEALRRGPGHPGFDLAQANTRAITDGLNQVPRESGETVRGIDAGGDPRLAELVAGPYEPGAVVVEPAFSSASIKTGEFATSKFGDDVELHVRSDNLRDISKLAENPSERESLSPPGTQLLVHERRLEVTPEGRRKWIIEAEEIGPGHPRYLDPEAAQHKMAERRAENDHNAAEFERRKQAALMERLGGFGEPEHVASPPEHPSVSDALDGSEPPVVPQPQPDYGHLARATNPPFEPAIHAGSATPAERAAYVQDRHPHLRDVNPGFHQPGALENGYMANCTRGPEAYVDRLRGGAMTAEPILFHEMGTRGTLEHIEGRFGETFSERGSYDDVIREMRDKPLDHHAVVAVKYEGPNGVVYGHVAMVVHTRDGVAFIDPQSGDLMHLPQPPKGIKLMHVGTPDEVHLQTGHTSDETHGGYGSAEPASAHAAAERFLGREDLQAALAHPDLANARVEAKDEFGRAHDLGPLKDYLEAQLPSRPELVRLLNDEANAYIAGSLAKRPLALGNLLAHDEAVRIFEDSLQDVQEQRERGTLPEEIPAEPQHIELGETERRVSEEATADNARYEDADRRQPPYPREHLGNATEFKRYLDDVYARAEVAMEKLREVVPDIAADTEGEADLRKTLKGRGRAEDKIESNYGGDPSRLTDIAGGIVRFEKIEMLYAALEKIRARDDIEIVEFEDRFVKPQPAGYSDLQMKVRIEGHVAEFRLHLKAVDAVSAYDHALYEVRRDIKARAVDEGPGPDPETGKKRPRPYTPEEQALLDALLKREREKFWEALNKRPEQ
ncbi:toxin glutamine deamidase domain-containing protein [Amycolatopsis sp. NPDC026612]|uniref:WXG100-like domain-containing protein n=1 Tax=Amycolatopsis sp. NPDC026612 TaxID=3155466 RepID=UPI0033E20F13